MVVKALCNFTFGMVDTKRTQQRSIELDEEMVNLSLGQNGRLSFLFLASSKAFHGRCFAVISNFQQMQIICFVCRIVCTISAR